MKKLILIACLLFSLPAFSQLEVDPITYAKRNLGMYGSVQIRNTSWHTGNWFEIQCDKATIIDTVIILNYSPTTKLWANDTIIGDTLIAGAVKHWNIKKIKVKNYLGLPQVTLYNMGK